MRITKLGDYAIRTMMHLAASDTGEIIRISEISGQWDIPESFLRKIIPLLNRAGLIRSVRGNKGGIVLAGDAKEMSVLQIIESVSGEISLNNCVLNPFSCSLIDKCRMHDLWAAAQTQLRATLAERSLADLAENQKKAQRATG